jgi:prepilin-type N-terminal cleavage/methylation domain-containing protein
MRRYSPHTRSGFTLIELLVAAALCVIIMYVMATAFKAGTDTLSQLKTLASIAEQQRTADTIMRRDLSAKHLDHFGGASPSERDISRVITTSTPTWGAVNELGYFQVVQPTPIGQNYDNSGTNPTPYIAPPTFIPYMEEGVDGSNNTRLCRATDHWMRFTCKLLGGSNQHDYYQAIAPREFSQDPTFSNVNFATQSENLVSQWAEVAYFLTRPPSMPTTPPDVGPAQPLFTLHRRIRLLAPQTVTLANAKNTSSVLGWVPPPPEKFPEVAFWQPTGTQVHIRVPSEVTTTRSLRLGNDVTALPTPWIEFTPGPNVDTVFEGSDILLTNVISMQIQLLADISTDYQDIPAVLGVGQQVYDTSSNTGGKPLRAIRITLRVYDPRNMLTRQMTIAQAL